jgi:hypothetical protein
MPLVPKCDPAIEETAAVELVQRRCLGCHDRDGIANHDFTTLEALRRAPIAQMIGSCQMPPDGEAPLSEPERQLLVGWSACPR